VSALSPAEWSRNWQALKDYLAAEIDANLEVAVSCDGEELKPTKAAHYSLVAAQRATLAKMRELEAGQ
jgi:hypothetical protein